MLGKKSAARVHGLEEPANLQGAKYMNREDKAWNSLALDSLMVFLRDSQCPVRPAVSPETTLTEVMSL